MRNTYKNIRVLAITTNLPNYLRRCEHRGQQHTLHTNINTITQGDIHVNLTGYSYSEHGIMSNPDYLIHPTRPKTYKHIKPESCLCPNLAHPSYTISQSTISHIFFFVKSSISMRRSDSNPCISITEFMLSL